MSTVTSSVAGTNAEAATPATEVREEAPDQAITILNPLDGSVVGTVQPASPGEASSAVRRAKEAASAWAATAPEQRGALLREAAAALERHAEEIAEWNHKETGRPAEEALGGVLAGVHTLQQYAELGPVHRGRSLRGNQFAADYTVPEPRGVVLALTPWNDPVAVACGLLGAALVTGNTVVHKPSERCPHLGNRLGEILAEVLPDGVLVTVPGGGGVGRRLLQEPGIAVVAHVGSSATGAAIARSAAAAGVHSVLENGGNDPLLIDDDVDPVWAAEQAAIGAFTNSGQICTSVERIYVHEAVAADFVNALEAEARRRNDARTLGPLVDDRLRRSVQDQVDEAVSAGARITVGGTIPDGPGSSYPATVLLDCTDEMTVMQEETFGPVAPVRVIRSFEEGLELAASGHYGLAASVLTANLKNAQRAVAALPVGTVKVNNVFGGGPGGAAQPRGASGHGFGYGPELLDEMTTVKVVHLEAPGSAEGSRR